MSAQQKSEIPGTRYYVLCPNRRWFELYVRQSGRKLQDCKCVCTADDTRGVGFTSPLTELVVLTGWADADLVDRIGFHDAGYNLISRYCRDKRVRKCPEVEV